VEIHQPDKSIGDGALLPRQVKQPHITEHPVGPRRIGVADCDDGFRGYRGRPDQFSNFPGQLCCGGRVDAIVCHALARFDVGGARLYRVEGEGDIAVDYGETIGGLERSFDDVMGSA